MKGVPELVIGERVKELLKVPESGFLGRFAPGTRAVSDQDKVVRSAILNPVESEHFRDKAKGKKSAVVIISDSTRGIPNELVLPPVIEELRKAGLAGDQITIMVAVGLHRLATPEELQMIKRQAGGIEAISHDAYNEGTLSFLGYSKDNTPIWINRKVIESDLKITIGKVEPHEFAGYTGGRKSILPGVAGEKTINWNHRPEHLEHPHAVPGRLEGNPIHEDMVEIALKVGVDFSLQVVLNEKGEALGAFAGGLIASHHRAVELSRELSAVKMEKRPNLVICHPGSALEINLYQALKAVFSAATIVEDGGLIILTAACPEGLGTHLFVDPYRGSSSLDEVLEKAKANYTAPVDHAILLAKVLKRKVRVFCHCPGVHNEVLQTMFLEPFPTLQSAVDQGVKMLNEPAMMVLDRAPALLADIPF